jgi:hypothetical protein
MILPQRHREHRGWQAPVVAKPRFSHLLTKRISFRCFSLNFSRWPGSVCCPLCSLCLCGQSESSEKRDGTVFFPLIPAKIPSKNLMSSPAQIAANRLNTRKSSGISPLNTSLYSRRFAFISGLRRPFFPRTKPILHSI